MNEHGSVIREFYFQILATIKIGPQEDDQKTKTQRILNKTFWLLGTSRNAILVIVCGVVGYSFKNAKMTPFKLIGDIPPGLPSIQLPPFSMQPESDETFSDMISSLGSGLIVVPLIALMESIAICKAFSNGKSVDATQVNEAALTDRCFACNNSLCDRNFRYFRNSLLSVHRISRTHFSKVFQ